MYREEIKTGRQQPTAARQQLDRGADFLQRAGTDQKIRIEVDGVEITADIDFTPGVGDGATRGAQGKQFDKSLGVSVDDLSALIQDLLKAEIASRKKGGA